jgi:hypothetical protein
MTARDSLVDQAIMATPCPACGVKGGEPCWFRRLGSKYHTRRVFQGLKRFHKEEECRRKSGN